MSSQRKLVTTDNVSRILAASVADDTQLLIPHTKTRAIRIWLSDTDDSSIESEQLHELHVKELQRKFANRMSVFA